MSATEASSVSVDESVYSAVTAEEVDICASVARGYADTWEQYLRVLDVQLRVAARGNLR